MVSARVQFDWSAGRPVKPMTFGFFFRPILPRLRPHYWICDDWPLRWPCSADATCALEFMEDGITPPDTVLPEFADEIAGDRDTFYAVSFRPTSAADFYAARDAAGRRDRADWSEFVLPPIDSPSSRQGQKRFVEHVARCGTHVGRFMEEYPVDYAFMTNDGVWWFATREAKALDELRTYARRVPGMSLELTPAFGM
jgi:hypothetical protein